MKQWILIRTAIKALLKNKRRTILTMLGIIIGISAVITIFALGRGFEVFATQSILSANSEDVSVDISVSSKHFSKDNTHESMLTEADKVLLESISQVKRAEVKKYERNDFFASLHTKQGGANAQGKPVIYTNVDNLLEGRQLTKIDNENETFVAIISQNLAQKLYPNQTSYLNQTVEMDDHLFKIVGIFKQKGMQDIFAQKETEIYIPKKTDVKISGEAIETGIRLILNRGANLSQVGNEAVKLLNEKGSRRKTSDYRFVDLGAITEGVGKVLSAITLFVSAIGGISLFIAGIGMMNMMYISISERTKEIGIRRALGATRNEIRSQFLWEGILVTTLGGMIGYIFGLIFATLVAMFLPIKLPIQYELMPIIITLGLSLSIGIIFSYAPANKASQKNVIDIL